MSGRAVIIAVLGGVFIATVGYFNDQVPRLNHFVGNQFPIIVFFPLILAVAVINPLLGLVGGRWRLRRAELAAVVALMLVTCNIPGSGLLRWWSRAVGLPAMYNSTSLAWQEYDALGYAPKALLVNDGRYDGKFYDSFWAGSDKIIAPPDVPWGAWARPLAVWMPMVALVAAASICMALIVHRSWSQRERLPYPVAQLATALVQTEGAGRRSIFRRNSFLLAAATVLLIHVINGAYLFVTKQSPRDPLYIDFSGPFLRKWPGVWNVPWGGNSVFYFPIYPTLVAFACLVAADVSFSVGIGIPAWTIVGYVLFRAGVKFEWITTAGGIMPWQTAGSAIAVGLVLLYLGRRFYLELLGRAVGLPGAGRQAKGYEVWACRLFILCAAGLVVMLVGLNVAWPIAIAAVLLLMLTYVVVARITVESGVVMMYPMWQPPAVLLGVLGARALGPHATVTLALVCGVLAHDVRECLMPMVLHGLRVCNVQKIPSARVASAGMIVFLVALAAAMPFSIWVDHNFGVMGGEGFATYAGPACPFNLIAREPDFAKDSGSLYVSKGYSPVERVLNMSPDRGCLLALAAGAAVVLVLMWLRLRYTWWPIHPILFVIWGTWAMRVVGYSFLLGWAIKSVCGRVGVKFAALRTFMIGVIVGDLAGGVLWTIVGAIYWAVTGSNAPRYHVFPGG